MDQMDLAGYDKRQLADLASQIAAEIERRKAAELAAARAQIEQIAQAIGRPLREIVGKAIGKSSSAKSIQPRAGAYAHPENPALVWSGRGRHPSWLTDFVAAGHTLDKLVPVEAE